MTLSLSSPIKRIAILSDVSVGYGTPQVLSLARSLARLWSASVTVFEPDQPERPPVDASDAAISVERIYTATHPYGPSGRTEFCLALIEALNRSKPDVVVFASFLAAPVIARLNFRPKAVIYYGLEHTDGGRQNEQRLFRTIASRIDLAIFPEENRAMLDRPRLGLQAVPAVIVYNGSNVIVPWVEPRDRNRRLFYGGLLHPRMTFGDWFFKGDLDDQPIDMFGIIDGYPDRDREIEALQRRQPRLRYCGYVPSGPPYLDMLRQYCFSLVLWTPHSESTHFAAPNKFFDAIAAGVPPIVAPHPLCVRLVERYRCGLILEDFTLEALRDSLSTANAMIRRGTLRALIEGCRAAQADLNWDAQFAKIVPALERMVGTGAKRSA